MDIDIHTLSDLFDQLGLPSTHRAVEQFVATHKPLPDEMLLHEAEFWSEAQRTFLMEAIMDDSDWAEQVDQLNALLRE
ncbi:DUF2789 domain-containing protein [Porticoccus sp.]